LSTAASFYEFANIKTNPEKAVLITNDHEALKKGYIDVLINGQLRRIKVTPHGHLERFLGVFINFGYNRKTLISDYL